MGSFSIWHWMLFGAVALLLFGGKGKISDSWAMSPRA